MSCAMVYWGRNFDRFFDVFMHHGAVVDLRPLQGKQMGDHGRRTEPVLLSEFDSNLLKSEFPENSLDDGLLKDKSSGEPYHLTGEHKARTSSPPEERKRMNKRNWPHRKGVSSSG